MLLMWRLDLKTCFSLVSLYESFNKNFEKQTFEVSEQTIELSCNLYLWSCLDLVQYLVIIMYTVKGFVKGKYKPLI